MPSPRPQPTALRVLRGNPGKRALNRQEPKIAPLSAECPAELVDPVARAEWDRVAPALIASGVVTVADRATLVGYCLSWAEWLDLTRTQTAREKSSTLMLRFAIELGMTPAARTRIHATPPATGSTWADVLP
jgi:phage terminase small subunit